MLYVDKHRPKTLEKLSYHPKITQQLKRMAASGDFTHLMVYGPSGAGKKTRIMAFLRELFGSGAEKLRVDTKSFKTPSNATVELTILSSSYHIELTPSDAGNHDRIIVQDVIKEIAQSPPLEGTTNRTFKVIVLNEVDRLSKDAQHALRRTMEKYVAVCRLILCCNSTCKVIEPVRSRCLPIRVPAPSNAEVSEILMYVSKREGFNLPTEFANKIAGASQRNLRKAVLMLEAAKVQQYPFQKDQRIDVGDWEEYTTLIAKQIIEEQSPKRLQEVRLKLYELLSHCIPADVVLRTLTLELLKLLDSEIKFEVIKWAAFYEHRLQVGSKAIFHLEAFIAKFMAVYKRYLLAIPIGD